MDIKTRTIMMPIKIHSNIVRMPLGGFSFTSSLCSRYNWYPAAANESMARCWVAMVSS